MYKVITVGQFDGVFKKNDKEINYSKCILVLSENGNYPRLYNCDIETYKKVGDRLQGKNIDLKFEKKYGKYKINEIKIID